MWQFDLFVFNGCRCRGISNQIALLSNFYYLSNFKKINLYKYPLFFLSNTCTDMKGRKWDKKRVKYYYSIMLLSKRMKSEDNFVLLFFNVIHFPLFYNQFGRKTMVDLGEKLYPLSFHSNQTSKQMLQFTNHTRIRIVWGRGGGRKCYSMYANLNGVLDKLTSKKSCIFFSQPIFYSSTLVSRLYHYSI